MDAHTFCKFTFANEHHARRTPTIVTSVIPRAAICISLNTTLAAIFCHVTPAIAFETLHWLALALALGFGTLAVATKLAI